MTKPVSLEDIQKMLVMAAALVGDDPAYLPIFLRIEQELALFDTQMNTIQRARAVAALHRAAA